MQIFACVCAPVCLSGSGCTARCLLTYWGFVVVVGGLLAVQRTEKELSIFFFCRNFYWSFVCVFTHVSVCMSVTRILILVVRRLFRDKTGGHGFRLSATSVHAFAAVCLFGLCHHCSLLFCFLMFLLSSNQVLRNFAFSRAPSIPFTASRVNLRLSYRLLKGRGSENDGSNGCIKDSSNPHVEFIAGFQQKENNGLE